jgi:acetyltransferase-like isoleucine patch superfamily enzyme
MKLNRDGRLFNELRQRRNRIIHRRKGLRHVDRTAYIHQTAIVAPDLRANEYVFVAPGCQIDPGVTLGRYTMLASHVAIVGDDHVWDIPGTPMQFSGRPEQTRTTIEADVWVGYRAIIRRGVTIGRGSIIAAQSVITTDVPSYSIFAGTPARRIGDRFSSTTERTIHDAMLDGPIIRARFAQPLRSPDSSLQAEADRRG